jgi:hypothetical protein
MVDMQRILWCLKISHFIFPLGALVSVSTWNAVQLKSISVLEKNHAELQSKISSALKTEDSPRGNSAEKSREIQSSKSKGAVDWKELADSLDFEKRVLDMSREDIIAALDEIDLLDLSDEARQALEEAMLDSLIQKDPQYALEHFGSSIKNDPDGLGFQLASALRAWAKKDLKAATAWFDRKIAAGDFESKSLDGKSEIGQQFEAALFDSLLAADFGAASARLTALPEDQRREILQQVSFAELSPDAQKAYANLVRQQVPQDERAGSFASIASELVDGQGYGKVDAFLNSVQATPEERIAAARQTAESQLEILSRKENLTRQDIDSMRAWLAKQAPDQVDAITGKAIAEASQNFGRLKFENAAKLALDYQKSTGNDDVLISFLKSYSNRSNFDEAKILVSHIRDPKIREGVQKRYR